MSLPALSIVETCNGLREGGRGPRAAATKPKPSRFERWYFWGRLAETVLVNCGLYCTFRAHRDYFCSTAFVQVSHHICSAAEHAHLWYAYYYAVYLGALLASYLVRRKIGWTRAAAREARARRVRAFVASMPTPSWTVFNHIRLRRLRSAAKAYRREFPEYSRADARDFVAAEVANRHRFGHMPSVVTSKHVPSL